MARLPRPPERSGDGRCATQKPTRPGSGGELRSCAHARAGGDSPPDLSVIVPAYKEEWRLAPTLLAVLDYLDARGGSYEVIVVDDGSSDDTVRVVQNLQRLKPQLGLLRQPENRGKGCAVRTGALRARGRRIVFTDADGSTPIEEVERLERALAAGADIAIGSRALQSRDTRVVTAWYRKALGRVFNWCVNALVLPGIADTQCGFKMFTSRSAAFLFGRQTADGFSFDVELLLIARRAGLRIAEVPVNWKNVPGSKVNLVVDSLLMFWDVIRFRIIHRHVSPALFAGFEAGRPENA